MLNQGKLELGWVKIFWFSHFHRMTNWTSWPGTAPADYLPCIADTTSQLSLVLSTWLPPSASRPIPLLHNIIVIITRGPPSSNILPQGLEYRQGDRFTVTQDYYDAVYVLHVVFRVLTRTYMFIIKTLCLTVCISSVISTSIQRTCTL